MIVLRAVKQPAEVVPLSWDFSADLIQDELISVAVVTVTDLRTSLAVPAMLVGGAVPATPLVTQKVSGGDIGGIYRVECEATSDASLKYQAETELHIIEE